MRNIFLINILLLLATFSYGQTKVIIKTCTVQYGTELNGKYLMDGKPVEFTTQFNIDRNYFKHTTSSGNYLYQYVSPAQIRKNNNFTLYLTNDDMSYEVKYDCLNNTISFIYDDGKSNRVSTFQIDKIKFK